MPDARRRKTKSSTSGAGSHTTQREAFPTTGTKAALTKRTLLISAVLVGSIFVLLAVWNGRSKLGPSLAQESVRNGQKAPLTHGAHTPPFVVADLPGRGKGLLASRNIKQGELLLRERPLFIVPREISSSPAALIGGLVAELGEDEQAAFFNLSYVHFPQHLDPDRHRGELALAIFQTNAVATGNSVGIFPKMARLNHGCSSAFNAVYTWREKEGALYVHALKAIGEGEELLTSYTNSKRSRHKRRAYLVEQYDFECQCSVCSLPDSASQASDKRLEAISDAYEKLALWGSNQISGTDAIAEVRKIWQLEDEEGYWSERGRLAADAAWVAAAHSDATATRDWARIAAEWSSYELGADSEQVAEMQRLVLRPESHSAWDTRRPLVVGGLSS